MSFSIESIRYGGRCSRHIQPIPCSLCAQENAELRKTQPFTPLDEAAVRRIVREELARSAPTAAGSPLNARSDSKEKTWNGYLFSWSGQTAIQPLTECF